MRQKVPWCGEGLSPEKAPRSGIPTLKAVSGVERKSMTQEQSLGGPYRRGESPRQTGRSSVDKEWGGPEDRTGLDTG